MNCVRRTIKYPDIGTSIESWEHKNTNCMCANIVCAWCSTTQHMFCLYFSDHCRALKCGHAPQSIAMFGALVQICFNCKITQCQIWAKFQSTPHWLVLSNHILLDKKVPKIQPARIWRQAIQNRLVTQWVERVARVDTPKCGDWQNKHLEKYRSILHGGASPRSWLCDVHHVTGNQDGASCNIKPYAFSPTTKKHDTTIETMSCVGIPSVVAPTQPAEEAKVVDSPFHIPVSQPKSQLATS